MQTGTFPLFIKLTAIHKKFDIIYIKKLKKEKTETNAAGSPFVCCSVMAV